MKKLLYWSIAILVLTGLIVYGFRSAPKVIRLDRQIEVTAYKLQDTSFAKPVKIALKGAFDEKSESYLGEMRINGIQYTNCSLSPELGFMYCALEGRRLPFPGQVYANKDFSQWSLAVQQSYQPNDTKNDLYNSLNQGSTTHDTIIISIPAKGWEAAVELYQRLQNDWVDKL
ncbi:hypothetical protein [Paenibacillus monticola]|uniref:Uncharacterized protein n=1 Tax=Paenibacillus monticola TaxID=2666075 RepID=A0A7X2L1W2_9BACL|nr:hypothetical protein [Paenibacillus monticola]MRN52686.1 hypothetical protein [Paenibacillus monticola]